jgi:hemoglobin
MLCMRGALAEQVADEALRTQLDRKLADLADFMRNQAEMPPTAG